MRSKISVPPLGTCVKSYYPLGQHSHPSFINSEQSLNNIYNWDNLNMLNSEIHVTKRTFCKIHQEYTIESLKLVIYHSNHVINCVRMLKKVKKPDIVWPSFSHRKLLLCCHGNRSKILEYGVIMHRISKLTKSQWGVS